MGNRLEVLDVIARYVSLNDIAISAMTEIFSTLFGQSETQVPPGSSAIGFGPGKPPPPLPQNQVSMPAQIPPQHGDEGPALRKPGVMNEPFYLLRELPGIFVFNQK